MAILLLYYPYSILLVSSYAPEKIAAIHIAISTFYLGLFLILIIPALTARISRGRRHWVGTIIVRLWNMFLLLLVLVTYIAASINSPITLASLRLPGYETAFNTAFAVVLIFFLLLFVIPGFYIQRLLKRHELATGTRPPAKETPTRFDLSNFRNDGKRPLWVKICIAPVLAGLFLGTIGFFLNVTYASERAIELYHTYWKYLFIFSLFSFVSGTLFVEGKKFEAFFRIRPVAGIMSIFTMALFSWAIPFSFFHITLPAYYQYVGNSELVFKNFVISGKLPYENERRCRRGAYIIDPDEENPRRQKICRIPEFIYRDLEPGSNLLISATKTEMGYNLGLYLAPK